MSLQAIGLSVPNQLQGQQLYGGRQAKVWIAYRDDISGSPLAVFASKALADIFEAGAVAAHGSVLIAEMPINYGGTS